MNLWTQTITGTPLNINKSDGVFKVSVLASGGNIGITGNFTFQGKIPAQQILKDGQGAVIQSYGTQAIDGLTIDPLSASAEVMVFFN